MIIREESNDKSVRKHYDHRTQSSIYTVDKCKQDIEEDYDYEDDELDSGDVIYEAEAYYESRYRGLAYSEKFADKSELDAWIWEMCQRGFYVEVYDYEDNEYSYYRWPDNGEYMDLWSSEQLETDRQGNFLYIDDVGLK